jgi:hypothetical protein
VGGWSSAAALGAERSCGLREKWSIPPRRVAWVWTLEGFWAGELVRGARLDSGSKPQRETAVGAGRVMVAWLVWSAVVPCFFLSLPAANERRARRGWWTLRRRCLVATGASARETVSDFCWVR